MDDYALQFHERVRNGYLAMAAADPERWAVIDADRSPDEVHRDVAEILTKKLKEAGRLI